MTAAQQLDLFAMLDEGLCTYGGRAGKVCRKPATHEAQWWCDREPFHGGKACCPEHANYYAMGWLGPALFYPGVCDVAAMRRLAAGTTLRSTREERMTTTTAGALPLRMPLIRFTVDGRRYLGDRSFFASTDLELFARLAVATPRDGMWVPAAGTDGRLSRHGDVPGSVLGIYRQVHRDRGRGAVWTSRPSVRERSGIVDDMRAGAPVEVAIVQWELSSYDLTVCVDGRKIDAIACYGAGQDITWRAHRERMVSGWWGDDTPTPILAAVVMGLASAATN